MFARSTAFPDGSASASAAAALALSAVTSAAGTARAVCTVTTSARTCTNPASTKYRRVPAAVVRRSSPAPSRPISAARPGCTPSSPSYSWRVTNVAGSSSTAFSGVTTTHRTVLPSAIGSPQR